MLSSEEAEGAGCGKGRGEGSPSGPQAPQLGASFFGPVLPPHLLEKKVEEGNEGKVYGPVLPNHLSAEAKEFPEVALSELPEKGEVFIGPALPEQLRRNLSASEEEDPLSCSDIDDSFGPSADLMATEDVANSYKLINAQKLSRNVPEDSPVRRETWMTELPEKRGAQFGLLPRHFKSRVPTDKESDASVWTDTPADKVKKSSSKKDHKEELKMKRLQERDRQMEKLAKKAAKKLRKKESLMEIHLKNMEKKKKKEKKEREKEGKTVPERRPFDRNVDLQVRKFDESQRRAMLNKSQFLNDRFAPGQSKFL